MFNKFTLTIGAMVVVLVGIAFTLYGVQQRQDIRPRAQDAGISCPIGSTPVTDPLLCPRGTVPIPVQPTIAGPQAEPTTKTADGGSLQQTQIGGNTFTTGDGDQLPGDDTVPPGDGTPINNPTPQIIGYCCVPQTTITPTPTIPIPVETITPPPVITSCPKPTVIPQVVEGCTTESRCDFSVSDDGNNTISTRSLWADGSFDFGDNTLSSLDTSDTTTAQRLSLNSYTYPADGDYQISLQCTDDSGTTIGTCTKQISITSDGGGNDACVTPTVPQPSPSPSPTPTQQITLTPPPPTLTPPACFLPIPRLEFECPDGCLSPTPFIDQPN